MRVISLVPSWTEFLHDLNVDVVGQTKYCVRPKSKFHTVTRIGGTKNIKVDQILALKPDLVLANREENDQMQVEHLSQHLPADGVMLTDVRKIEDAWIEMARIGERVERLQHTRDLLSRIQDVWGNPKPERGKVTPTSRFSSRARRPSQPTARDSSSFCCSLGSAPHQETRRRNS